MPGLELAIDQAGLERGGDTLTCFSQVWDYRHMPPNLASFYS